MIAHNRHNFLSGQPDLDNQRLCMLKRLLCQLQLVPQAILQHCPKFTVEPRRNFDGSKCLLLNTQIKRSYLKNVSFEILFGFNACCNWLRTVFASRNNEIASVFSARLKIKKYLQASSPELVFSISLSCSRRRTIGTR